MTLLASLIATPSAARAASVPQHPVATSLRLEGASTAGVVVRQGAVSGETGSVGSVLTGAEGTRLARNATIGRALASPAALDNAPVLGVLGSTLAWYRKIPVGGGYTYQVHRSNLLTRVDVLDGELPPPVAFTGTSWLSDASGFFPDISGDAARPLTRSVIRPSGTGLLPGEALVADVQSPVAVAADQTSVLLATVNRPAGPPTYHLDLISLSTGTAERVLDTSSPISSISLSPDTLAWDALPAEGARQIFQRRRAGGTITSYAETNDSARAAELVAGEGDVGYLVPDPEGTYLKVVTGSTGYPVDLPKGGSGLAAVGGRFLTATGGSIADAGVYSIAGQKVTRVATVPAAGMSLSAMAFSNSRLYYVDGSDTDAPGLPLRRREVSGRQKPVLSTPALLFPRATAPTGAASSISFSAGRGAIGLPGQKFHWQLLDRGGVVAYIEQRPPAGGSRLAGVPTTSGPFSLIAGQVFRGDGEYLYSEPDFGDGQDDLFGSRVIYSRMRGADQAAVWLVDVTTGKQLRLSIQRCTTAPLVAIWGQLAAWQNCSTGGVTVRNLNTGANRSVAVGAGAGAGLSQLQLREGTLGWLNGGVVRVFDLATAKAVPVALAGVTKRFALDDGRIARQFDAAHGGGVEVARLPFVRRHRPRLIGMLGPRGFTPNGDRDADSWDPQFDVSKPLAGVRLRITTMKTGKTLRVLKGTGPDGSIRDLSWNGRTTAGALLPVGTYRWQLIARAQDGDGDLIGINGAKRVTGTLEINRG